MASKEETETIIIWTAGDERAEVYSLMPKVWRWCEKAGGERIKREEGTRKGVEEARTYLVDVGCIRIKPRRMVTPARRDALSAQLARAKRPKNPPPA